MSLLDQIARGYRVHNRQHERKLRRLMHAPAETRADDCNVLRAELNRLRRQELQQRDDLMQMRRERDGFKALWQTESQRCERLARQLESVGMKDLL